LLGDAIILPFEDERFDVVVSFDVMDHVEDDLKFLSKFLGYLEKMLRIVTNSSISMRDAKTESAISSKR
jgi:2-polyprenyl-3-methyl-5-hydroxy-6-metoxy-1,4-benzoquinol methylase